MLRSPAPVCHKHPSHVVFCAVWPSCHPGFPSFWGDFLHPAAQSQARQMPRQGMCSKKEPGRDLALGDPGTGCGARGAHLLSLCESFGFPKTVGPHSRLPPGDSAGGTQRPLYTFVKLLTAALLEAGSKCRSCVGVRSCGLACALRVICQHRSRIAALSTGKQAGLLRRAPGLSRLPGWVCVTSSLFA